MADSMSHTAWDARYRDGSDRWELGRPAPPLEAFLRADPRAPQPPGRVLVPGCGRGHEARLLAELGFVAVGLDFSAEAILRARQTHGVDHPRLRWVQADLLDAAALGIAGMGPSSVDGVLEHTCFCALDPADRGLYVDAVVRCLAPVVRPGAVILMPWPGSSAGRACGRRCGSRPGDRCRSATTNGSASGDAGLRASTSRERW